MPENQSTNTDEQRLAEFSQKLDSFRPDGFEEAKFNELKESLLNFHKSEVQGLKINTAKMKEEKEALSEKYKLLESSSTTQAAELKDLQGKLAASQPDELRKHYEQQQAQLSEVFTKKEKDLNDTISRQAAEIESLKQGVKERDVMTEFNKLASKKTWIGRGREYAEKIICGPHGSSFNYLDMGDGTRLLVNEQKQDMAQAFEKFCEDDYGKSLIMSGSSGGGADGSTSTTGTGKRLTQAEYDALSPQARMDFDIDGGQIV